MFVFTKFKIKGGFQQLKEFFSDWGGGSPRGENNFFAFLDNSDHV